MLQCKTSRKGDTAKLTFSMPMSVAAHVSVVGDFNGWDPLVHPMKKRSNGTRSVSVEVPTGTAYSFKYLGDGGTWLCEPDAASELNEYGQPNSVVRL